MEENVSGFEKRGGWVTIVEHGERITTALEDEGIDGKAFEKWDEWRPKADERLSEDVDEKTVDHVRASESEGEKAGVTPHDDLKAASEEVVDAVEELTDGNHSDAAEEGQDAIEYTVRATDSAARKTVRAVETPVYRHVMTQVSPHYFDNELVSANIERTRDPDERYVFEVDIVDDNLKDTVSDRLAVYDEEIDRWRIETEPDTETTEAAEGVNPPDE